MRCTPEACDRGGFLPRQEEHPRSWASPHGTSGAKRTNPTDGRALTQRPCAIAPKVFVIRSWRGQHIQEGSHYELLAVISNGCSRSDAGSAIPATDRERDEERGSMRSRYRTRQSAFFAAIHVLREAARTDGSATSQRRPAPTSATAPGAAVSRGRTGARHARRRRCRLRRRPLD